MYSLNKAKRNILNESGIRVPKGTHGVKLYTHEDMDGFFSGLFAYRQLLKQGIDPKNIVIKFVQYGWDGGDGIKWDTKKGQALCVFDFAAVPIPKEGEEGGQRNRKWSEKDQEELDKVRQSIVDYKGSDKWKKVPKEMEDKLEALKRKKFSPDFVSDHHNNSKGDLVAGTSGKIAAPFRSDSEHIAVSFAHNVADWSTIDAVSKIDSAQYDNLMDTLTLPTNFKNKGRMDRLANIVNTLLSKLLKKNKNAAIELMKTAQPSLVSVYLGLKNSFKMNDLQMDGLEELVKESPDWKKVDEIRKQLPKGLEISSEKAGKLSTMERLGDPKEKLGELRKKGEEDLEKARSGYWGKKLQDQLDAAKAKVKELKAKKEEVPPALTKEIADLTAKKKEKQGDFQPIGNVAMRMAGGKTGRYTGQLLSRKGKFMPFVLKRWGGSMIQVSANPQLPEDMKKEIDLNADMQEVLKNIKTKFQTRYNQWAFEIVDKDSGGHKGITTISGLGTLGLMVKEKREKLKYLEDIKKRADAVGLKMKEKMPNHDAYLRDLKTAKEKAAEERTKIMDEIEREFYAILSKKYGHLSVPGVGTNDVKEEWTRSINKILQEM